jgi:cellobiose phosphorylase
MKKLLLLFTFISTTLFAQPPLTADSIYWSGKYCNTAQTIEDCTNSWIFSGNWNDCIQPSEAFCNAIMPEAVIFDTYECCCQVASAPGSESAWNGFFGGACQEYLDSIGFIYDDPEYVNWTSIEENIINKFNGIYIDIYGRMYVEQPNGLSILNRKKYFKVK